MLEDCNPRWLFYEPEFESHSRQLAWPRQPIHGPWLDSDAAPAILGTDQHDVLIVYTSGTTGVPKGAVLTQNALLWNGFNSIHAHDLSQADHVLSALPMFHVGGLNNQTLPALQAGATVTLHRRFAPGAWLADVSARKPSLSLLVPGDDRRRDPAPGLACSGPVLAQDAEHRIIGGPRVADPRVPCARRAGRADLRLYRDRADRHRAAEGGCREPRRQRRQTRAPLRSTHRGPGGTRLAGRNRRRGLGARTKRDARLLEQPGKPPARHFTRAGSRPATWRAATGTVTSGSRDAATT